MTVTPFYFEYGEFIDFMHGKFYRVIPQSQLRPLRHFYRHGGRRVDL